MFQRQKILLISVAIIQDLIEVLFKEIDQTFGAIISVKLQQLKVALSFILNLLILGYFGRNFSEFLLGFRFLFRTGQGLRILFIVLLLFFLQELFVFYFLIGFIIFGSILLWSFWWPFRGLGFLYQNPYFCSLFIEFWILKLWYLNFDSISNYWMCFVV